MHVQIEMYVKSQRELKADSVMAKFILFQLSAISRRRSINKLYDTDKRVYKPNNELQITENKQTLRLNTFSSTFHR